MTVPWEVNRSLGKSDPLDAAAIGTAVLSLEEYQTLGSETDPERSTASVGPGLKIKYQLTPRLAPGL